MLRGVCGKIGRQSLTDCLFFYLFPRRTEDVCIHRGVAENAEKNDLFAGRYQQKNHTHAPLDNSRRRPEAYKESASPDFHRKISFSATFASLMSPILQGRMGGEIAVSKCKLFYAPCNNFGHSDWQWNRYLINNDEPFLRERRFMKGICGKLLESI